MKSQPSDNDDWMADGACKGAPTSLFVLEQGITAAEGKKYCMRCTVRPECEAYARRTGSVGVWGGKLFSIRDPEPTELMPLIFVQDGRPRRITWESSGGQLPGIFGEVSNFRNPGILG